ncbi:MAG: radical SAM protein [Nitrososphaerota archaeon]|nr:radical SAM protein [Nitrososphaerota archaeon]
MRISLISPPSTLEDFFGKLSQTGSLQQPLGVAYISSYLKRGGQSVQLVDAAALRLSIPRLISEVKSFHPDLIGISAVTPSYLKTSKVAQKLKAELGVPIIVGGPHVTSLPLETLSDPSFDYGVMGEGEITSLELLQTIESGKDLSDVKGIVYRDRQTKELRITPRREYIRNLDELPFPDRESLPPLTEYHPSQSSYRRLPLGTLISSRGCPHHCIFCDRAVFGNSYRARGAVNVVDEIELLVQKHRAREVRFWDDTFNLLPPRVIQICSEIRRRKLDIEWSCVARVTNMTNEILYAMRQAGCWQVDYGVESGNPEILKSIHKGMTMDWVRRGVRLSRENGLRVRAFFMLGLPGETEETMQQTINFAKNLDLDVAVFHIATPLPGTELYKIARERGELAEDVTWDKYLMFSAEELPYVTKTLTREVLREYSKRAYREFYMRPRFIMGQVSRIRTKEDIQRYAKAFTTIRNLD